MTTDVGMRYAAGMRDSKPEGPRRPELPHSAYRIPIPDTGRLKRMTWRLRAVHPADRCPDGSRRDPAACGGADRLRLAGLRQGSRRAAIFAADADHASERSHAGAGVDVRHARARPSGHADRCRRGDVCHGRLHAFLRSSPRPASPSGPTSQAAPSAGAEWRTGLAIPRPRRVCSPVPAMAA